MAKAERYPDAAEETLAGCAVPLLRLAEATGWQPCLP